jgi:REP element-mobilizing transposase RayT
MKYNPDKHRRRSIRFTGYNYSLPGVYFVTICVKDRECFFGEIGEAAIKLNDAGIMIQESWEELPKRFESIDLDEFVVMPNHLHGIVVLKDSVGASLVDAQYDANDLGPARGTLKKVPDESDNNVHTDIYRAGTRPAPTNAKFPDIIGSFKSLTTNQYIKGVRDSNWLPFNKKLWQRNYYEHIVRNEKELDLVRKYIIENPLKWDMDNENPNKIDTKK